MRIWVKRMIGQNAFRVLCQLWLMVGLASCNLINPDEKVPAYIKVDSVQVTTTADQGTARHNIKDVWVYMDGDLMGVYQLPALFPVIANEGKHSFIFSPGIYDNGIANTHIIYRLMKGYSTAINIVNGATVSADTTAVITYFPEVEFSWMEDFEDGTMSTVTLSGDSLNYETDITKRFEGNASGRIDLSDSISLFRFEMFEGKPLPTTSSSYLELHYKCDQPFFIGLKGIKSNGDMQTDVILVNASETWNKIYVNLGLAVRELSPATGYKIYCYSSIGSGISSATYYFDNFKLVHN